MVKINKSALPRHEVTLSPAVSEFAKATASIPLYQLPKHLASFPRGWPFPRGDLYHWIPALNRFDQILEVFNSEYGLTRGPQTECFGRRLLLKGEGAEYSPSASLPDKDTLDENGFSEDGDHELIESVLVFTRLLLDNCGNRNLYASSIHLNYLLNTTSLSLLKVTLHLSLRLAQRYYASRQRMPSTSSHAILLSSHYAISLDNMHRLASAFAKPTGSIPSASKGKEKPANKSDDDTRPKWATGDLVGLTTEEEGDKRATVRLTFYDTNTRPSHAEEVIPEFLQTPVTPTPARRSSNLSQQQYPPASPETDITTKLDSDRSTGPKVLEISAAKLQSASIHDLVKESVKDIPEDYQYETLHRIRVASAMSSTRSAREDIVAVRLLAIANLAYVFSENIFHSKISQPDYDEPRRFQLPYQLAELVQPQRNSRMQVSTALQSCAIITLESLTKHKNRSGDVVAALSVNVNHGVLFYVVRKVVTELANDDTSDEAQEEYRDSIFDLLNSLPMCQPRTGETLISAGLLEVLVEILNFRTRKAEWNYPRVLGFLDSFLFSIRDAFQSFVNAKGLDSIADLTSFQVDSAYSNVKEGKTMPSKYKTQLTDYEIQWHQQQNLRWLVKLTNRMLTHANANFERLLRNLMDSPQLLRALRTVLENAKIFGSTVWSTAVAILTNFLHNEPTSYAVVAEAGLCHAFLEAVISRSLPQASFSEMTSSSDPAPNEEGASSTRVQIVMPDAGLLNRINHPASEPLAPGILPSADAMSQIPPGFGAICLNEAGMKLFKHSRAMESFFEVFESPVHVKAMEQEQDMAGTLGSSFDELVRHHPNLKSEIVGAISVMIGRVGKLCFARASELGAGAKLWLEDDIGRLHVAGGREALQGDSQLHNKGQPQAAPTSGSVDDDLDMHDAEPLDGQSTTGSAAIDQVLECEDAKDTPSTTQYIGAVCRFLTGFFSNSNSIFAFAEGDGIELLIDFAIMPSLPYNVSDDAWANSLEDLCRVLQPLIEQKPHLVLPQLISRAQRAVDVLKPLIDHAEDTAFFSPFTTSKISIPRTEIGHLDRTVDGTKYVKALVSVQTLCAIMSYAFQNQFFSQRSNHNIFSQVNLADLYSRLIYSLGRLHRSCVWEEVLLQRNMPREWESSTRVKGSGMNSEELDSLLDMGRLPPADLASPATTNRDPVARATGNEQESAVSSVVKESATARFKNTRTLRFLLCRVPTAITPFLQSLGKLLLFRRSSKDYHKQCAYVVADQIAKATIDQLLFAPPKNSISAKDRYPYWITILTSISRVMLDDSMERGFPQTITLILVCFKNQGGFEALQHILESFINEASTIVTRPLPDGSSLSSEEQGLLDLSFGGIRIILNFYAQIINSKIVGEAVQTAALAQPDREKTQDYFSIGQFIVELRLTVMRPVMQLWKAELMEKCTIPIVKSLVDTLKIVLEAEGESNAFKRSDSPLPRANPTLRPWKMRSDDGMKKLTDLPNVDESLAREALYRCNDNVAAAIEYCKAFLRSSRPTRNDIPRYENKMTQATQRSAGIPAATNFTTMQVPESTAIGPSEMDQSIIMEDVAALAPGEAEASHARTDNAGGSSSSSYSGPSYFEKFTVVEARSKMITIDDLNDQRNELRSILIDRSLEVLNAHEAITFDLSDLISAAVTKAQDPVSLRREIGQTLVQSLISFQVDDDLRPNAKQIAASAHLLGLTLQDKPFYDATLEQLQDNFEALLSFVKIFPSQGKEDSSPWIGPVLLVLEMLLSDDARPPQIQWTPPSGEESSFDISTVAAPTVIVRKDQKIALFKAITELLPYVGKDEVLALAISRILVILTRQREIATLLSQKKNIQRLFLMVRQLSGITNEKLQSAFLVILRHMVEDDETIRQIMRSEIQSLFETREGRQKDTTGYTRHLYHLAIRNPDIFVEVTNEKLMLPRWEPSQRPQSLALKPAQKSNTEPSTKHGVEAVSTTVAIENERSSITEGKKPEKQERTKTQELRCPVVETPDGVIHYLLCELLAYKDVEDKPTATTSNNSAESSTAAVIGRSSNEGDSQNSTPSLMEAKKPEKQDFKAEQHPFFIYRCFILQCLTELLSSYNRAKVEFINFSRKADPHASTPSKPRSGILNYLLNSLVPVASLSHAEDTANRKQAATSNWAMLAIVGLCAKTEEKYASMTDGVNDADEDMELLYVRRFVLEHALKSFRDATASLEPLDSKYARLMVLAELFNRMINGKLITDPNNPAHVNSRQMSSQKQLSKIMYEKNFVVSLTGAIAEIDLNYPNAERAVRHILKTLRTLTSTGVEVSTAPASMTNVVEFEDDDIASTSSSLSDVDGREATPDLFRNSTLGLLDPTRQDEYESESEDGEEDEDDEMDDGYYEDEMEFEDDNPHGNEDAISDDEDEIDGVGPIEGLSGDVAEVELTIDDGDSDMDDDEDEDDDDSGDDEEEEEDDDDEDMDDIMNHVEIIAEEDDGSSGESGEEDGWENEDNGEDYPGQDDMEDDAHVVLPPLDNLMNLNDTADGLVQTFRERGNQATYVIEDEMVEEDDEVDDVDEEDAEAEVDYEEGDDFLYGDHYDDDEEEEGGAWRWDDPPPPMRAHHLHGHHHHGHTHAHRLHPWMGSDRGLLAYRSHRPGTNRNPDDGTNPLLQRSGRTPAAPQVGAIRHMAMQDFFHSIDPLQSGRFMAGDGPVSFISNLINAIGSGGPTVTTHNGNIHLSFGTRVDQLPPLPGTYESSLRRDLRRAHDVSGSRGSRESPNDAVAFVATDTKTRWVDEARILYGATAADVSQRLINSILRLLVPPAMEAAKQKAKELAERQARKAKEDAEAREKAEKERAEREAKEQKEREEKEAAEAEARAREQAEVGQDLANENEVSNAMEGVEVAEEADDADIANEVQGAESESQARVTTTIRGREIDITNLGIDMEYLEALPDELREEVLMQRVAEQRSEAVAAGEAPTDISPEFLEALPADIREEILQQEAQDRRRREREEARRRGNAGGAAPPPRAEEMDPASFLASLDPGLRQAVLMDQDEEMLGHLPAHIAAEARALGGDRHLNQFNGVHRAERPRILNLSIGEESQKKAKPRPAAQMLDKAGIATLLRLMFIPQEKRYLNETLKNVCQNRQNRAEVISILLSILQDGSADVNAVERSFAQLTIRAKQPTLQKTPQPKRSISGYTSSHSELSPLMVVQQCLTTLSFLAEKDSHIPSFFLSEHETTAASLKTKTPRKGKNKENKVSRFPLNALLSLLDRKVIIESSIVMEQLAALLSKITVPLQVLVKKEQGKVEQALGQVTNEGVPATPSAVTASAIDATGLSISNSAGTSTTVDVSMAATAEASTTGMASTTTQAESNKPEESLHETLKKPKALTAPEVPDYNLRLVVNILAARECSSKTFRDTLSVISYLSAIPGAKEVFGQELISQSQDLGQSILNDLAELVIQISTARTGTDVQGLALANFSPASSDQAKLLRVLTALDYLFDPKRADAQDKHSAKSSAGLSIAQKEDILTRLYENPTFASLWGKLSECLAAIRQRENMFNVATILLPLIEILMIVCKNTSLKDSHAAKSHQKEFTLSSPPPESRMENLFFAFTEDHRKILNDLVRHNPKLMSGSFSLLVRNSKVLEFDNKRNYFSRRLHSRTETRQPHQPLQLSVRRDQVFLDSFRSLYFKSADEMKYGKLNIRFHGEEGVDAGGVTREWFQVLARQMFDANYALFVPVASDRTTFHPNRLSSVNSEHLTFFKFIGRIIGKALYEGRVLDCHFSRAVYKRILGKPVSIKDMESLDVEYYKSLLWMLENDITDIITETFSTETDDFGDAQTIDLIENGRNISVTEENKHEYVRLVVEYKLTGSVQEQLESFLKGFHDIIPAELISIFNEQELELLISGLPDIDVDDWKNNTDYHSYTAAAPQVQWFWRAVRSFDKEERAKLLQFVTGTSKVPLNGFKELEGMNGFNKFNIHRDPGNKDRLPSSHTCFNQLDLPEYISYEKLREQLYTAMTAGSEYFGFA
ncbi:hypothetical protein EJ05DRAFT_204624 [Pseudovirgaria hyperparasitica]|uniref:HECT-type E3 ubiquitin transferase n=1 Tax=Pseudovirgaria hyperparasitica TaxID=470096 RepID=A0A6A6WJB1_9PEZI|nr:uncharacterized protein EJ05DRAFT_204624 [Pseudovirgaria hyperparasitica]KAF2762305.1 hypothetical protein EJ05DRAFT_204624 [Pseudovirgaria hyperparasitica]